MKTLSPETLRYLATSYPTNHNYSVDARGRLKPKWKLRKRWWRLRRVYPKGFQSFLDIGCSKGFFCFQAALRGARALGIDLPLQELAAAEAVRDHLNITHADFQRKSLADLAKSSAQFEVVQLINIYHYLYFGNNIAPAAADNHADLFRMLAKVCQPDGMLIFSNCEKFSKCPNREFAEQHASAEKIASYNSDEIRQCAAKYFTVNPRWNLGNRPFWCGIRNANPA